MPDLHATLLKYDLGHLNIIAELWGIEIRSRDVDSAADEVCASLLDPEAVRDTIDILPAEARAALSSLVEANGKMEWGLFSRKFGEIHEMGAGRRDREKPYLKPGSAPEILFYRGLLAKGFFDSDKGAQEYAYIPEDLVPLISHKEHTVRPQDRFADAAKPGGTPVRDGKANIEILGRLATPAERSFEHSSNDRILDDATTLLAALRLNLEPSGYVPRSGMPPHLQEHTQTGTRAPALQKLLSAAKVLKKNTPQAEAVKKFLAAPRTEALQMLYKAWLDSHTFDELRLIPELTCEGEWINSPRETRRTILSLLNALPKGKWWSIPAFLHDLKTKQADFQRPAGDYDSWFIKRESDGQYLRGFAHWDEVDGAVVKVIIHMLYALGRVDLANAEENGAVTSFRFSTFVEKKGENENIGIASNGTITVTRLFPRAVRYQLARFCEWEAEKADEYKYRISARSLKRANEQGLKAEQLLSLLVKHTKGNVPPALVKALKRWEANGAEARLESLSVLRVSKPEVITELRKSKAGKFLGELLSPTAIVVKEGAIQKVMAALAELGLLAEVE